MQKTMMTPYEWCIENNIRILNLETMPDLEFEFYTRSFDIEGMDTFISTIVRTGATVVPNELHLKSEKYLELRMYSLVPYNLLGIQMGIQHEHSVVDYVKNNLIDATDDRFIRWATEWKTSILLNGGTSNEGHYVRQGFKDVWYVGSMQQHLNTLKENGIKCSTFYEPDLNSMLTGISFIVDERVFNRRLYKDFQDIEADPDVFMSEAAITGNDKLREDWIRDIGGEGNVFLRSFLSKFQLARG